MASVEVSKEGCAFLMSDSCGIVDHLRKLVRIAAEDVRLRSLESDLGLPPRCLADALTIPEDGVKCFFARYGDISFRTCKEEEAFLEDLQTVVKTWSPLRVPLRRLHVVHEFHPYMQMPKRLRIGASDVVSTPDAPARGNTASNGVYTSPIVGSFALQDMFACATGCGVAAEESISDDMTLTPLSPLYHKYLHSSSGLVDAETGEEISPCGMNMESSDMILTPLSALMSPERENGSMSPPRGSSSQQNCDFDHLVADSIMFSPTVHSPGASIGTPQNKSSICDQMTPGNDAQDSWSAPASPQSSFPACSETTVKESPSAEMNSTALQRAAATAKKDIVRDESARQPWSLFSITLVGVILGGVGFVSYNIGYPSNKSAAILNYVLDQIKVVSRRFKELVQR